MPKIPKQEAAFLYMENECTYYKCAYTFTPHHTYIHDCSFDIFFFLIEDTPKEAGDTKKSFLTNIGGIEALPSERNDFCLLLN